MNSPAPECDDRTSSDFLLSVIVPIYNESNTIVSVIDKLRRTELPLEFVLVDDGSTDNTAMLVDDLALQHDVKLIRHECNRGKGAAIRSAIPQATGDVIAIQDADHEYDPNDLRMLVMPILSDQADVVFGSRFENIQSNRWFDSDSPWWHRAVNRLITRFAGLVIGVSLSDVETCYKLARREHFQAIAGNLRESRFGIEIELAAKWAAMGLRIAERPINYRRRGYRDGKKIGWRDGVSALRCIIIYGLPARFTSHLSSSEPANGNS